MVITAISIIMITIAIDGDGNGRDKRCSITAVIRLIEKIMFKKIPNLNRWIPFQSLTLNPLRL